MASILEEVVVETPAFQTNPSSEPPPPPPQTKILETVLSFTLQLSFSCVMYTTGPSTPPEAHKLALMFYIFGKFVIYTLDVMLVIYFAGLSYGVIKPISNFVKYLMCVVVATSFAACAFGMVLNVLA
ncbi:hypothetical protein COCNU_scaffold001302G000030 [Cocos nucifera]|nr:hypothetical protein [Cocos nucifera]